MTVSISPALASLLSSSAERSPTGVFISFSIHDEHLANGLDRFGLRAFAQGSQRLFAFLALDGRRTHLDQLVRLQGEIDFLHHFVGEAFGPDDDHRLELVGSGLERLALGRS